MTNITTQTREEVLLTALNLFKMASGVGTIVLDTGVGKSKVAIDFVIESEDVKTILITSPRENLKANWYNELQKWCPSPSIFTEDGDSATIPFIMYGKVVLITFENIQTCYKWSDRTFDLLIADEIHTIVTPEYSKIFENNTFKYKIGLTATPDIKGKPEKLELYNKYCPIIYTFLTAEQHGVVNKTKIVVIDHKLNNLHKIEIKTKKHHFFLGESERYSYICSELKRGQRLMASTGSTDFFDDAADWFWKGNGTPMQKSAARVYLTAIQNRKYFLLKLTSARAITKKLCDRLLTDKSNKILVFSELTDQINSICKHTVHSKHTKDHNVLTLQMFNDGSIKMLGSCYSLTLGLNMRSANIAIFESYLSSYTRAKQRKGRLNRLDVNDVAQLYILRILDTQAESWFNGFIDKEDISEVISSEQILNE